MSAKQSIWERIFRVLASLKTGITLLITVGIASAAGTFILQRPLAEPEALQRAYSPQTLQWLDRLHLTDIYHAPWFVLLMAALGVSILCASIDRWPKAWRMVARPYMRPEPHFRAVLPMQRHFTVKNASQALMATEMAMKKRGLHPRRVVEDGEVSVFAERHLLSVFAVYVVHASLLLILAGGIIDAIYGYHGFIMLKKGETTTQVELRTGTIQKLPFALRCDGAGQENYPDGTPKKWWSDLVVTENGVEKIKKQIAVNDPLITHGIRFYQASYGNSGDLESVRVFAGTMASQQAVTIYGTKPATLPDGSTIRIVSFLPDAAVRDGQIYAKSDSLNNPAFELQVTSAKTAKTEDHWLIPTMQASVQIAGTTVAMRSFDDIETVPFTGLQVSHEPGQWAVWGGCLLMALGLVLAFYLVHQRFWATAYDDAKSGATVLWIGSMADKNREHFQELFDELTKEIEQAVGEAAAKPELALK